MATDHPEIEIRDAGIDDVDVLAEVGGHSFVETYAASSGRNDIEAHVDQYFGAAAVRREIEQHRGRYILALVDGSPGGFAKYRDADCPTDAGLTNPVELQQLYVLQRRQRLGLGGRLVSAVFEKAEQRKASGVWLSVWQDADWAVSFYRKTGFNVVGTAAFALGSTNYDDFVMWRPIDGLSTGNFSATQRIKKI